MTKPKKKPKGYYCAICRRYQGYPVFGEGDGVCPGCWSAFFARQIAGLAEPGEAAMFARCLSGCPVEPYEPTKAKP